MSLRLKNLSLRYDFSIRNPFKGKKNNNQTFELADIHQTGTSGNTASIINKDLNGHPSSLNVKYIVKSVPIVIKKIVDLDFGSLFSNSAKHTKDGRHIPLTMDKTTEFYLSFTVPSTANCRWNLFSYIWKSSIEFEDPLLVDERSRKEYINNTITSSRYTLYTFFPRQIYAQFSKLANVYFFVIAVLQMIPGWSTTGTYTTIIPILIFMGISMAREAYDDWKRHRLDKEENERMIPVLRKTEGSKSVNFDIDEILPFDERFEFEPVDTNDDTLHKFNDFEYLSSHYNINVEKKRWADVKVGDMLILTHDDWVPADILLVTSDNPNHECYVETMALDGETNLKCRVPHPQLDELAHAADTLADLQTEIIVEDPNINLYNFDGKLNLDPHSHEISTNSHSHHQSIYPLTNDNVIYRGSTIRNTDHALGMVIFTGEETKIRMNALRNPRTKAPKLQRNINIIIAFMVFVVAMVSFFSYLGHVIPRKKYVDNGYAWYLRREDAGAAATIMSFIIMYNTMIPLSLYVTMEIIKVFQGKFMEWDIDMYNPENDTACESRSATILEELGQVSYIFSDKTGTLTNNKMAFKKYSIAGSNWEHNVLTEQDEKEKEHAFRNLMARGQMTLIDELKPTFMQHNNLKKTSSNLDVISIEDPILNKLGIKQSDTPRNSNAFYPTTSIEELPDRKTSVQYKGTASAVYTGRPSMRSLFGLGPRRSIESPRPSHVRRSMSARKSKEIGDSTIPEFPTEYQQSPFEGTSRDANGDIQYGDQIYSTTRQPKKLNLTEEVETFEDELEAYESSSISDDVPELKTSFELIEFIQHYPNTLFARKAKFFILALALCHSCLPRRKHIEDNDGNYDPEEDIIEYQSSSPDELALVTAARDLGYVVANKNAQTLTIKTYPNGFDAEPVLENYEILNIIDFNSSRKRMSVLVKVPEENNRILLICKGADNVILDRLQNNDVVQDKIEELQANTRDRKENKAEVVLQHKKSLERMANNNDVVDPLRNSLSGTRASLSLQAMRKNDAEQPIESIDQFLATVQKADSEINHVSLQNRKSLKRLQRQKYGPRYSLENVPQGAVPRPSMSHSMGRVNDITKNTVAIEVDEQNNQGSVEPDEVLANYEEDMFEYIGNDDLILNEEYVIERTLEAIDEFSTEGLRTLLYGYKWIDNGVYEHWAARYNEAKISLTDRSQKIQDVGAEIEEELHLVGATAIEDKLQDGVPEAIEKIRRAGIRIWMLTGDKRETAINIGHSCKMIFDYSTVVILGMSDENIISKMNALSQELLAGNIAHCVLVIDGPTLTMFESNPTMMSVFIELCTKTDSVICCRASPSQKALLVSNIRNTDRNLVTLAIGDGANDIAMIQSADIGIGIAGKEGLQASRSSDYSIGQFRFLLKLLFVHGRYNYIRTAKFILTTFFKEIIFYLTQVMYQRYTMFSGSSLYEPWSLSMYNTLFTSLPVLCVGILEKDLKPATLLSVPELYTLGRLSKGFNLLMFIEWASVAACHSASIFFLSVVMWGENTLSDNSTYPLGVVNFTAIIFVVCFKCQFLEMRNRNIIVFICVLLSAGGWLIWCVALPILHPIDDNWDVKYGFLRHFGRDITFWCSVLVLTMLSVSVEIVIRTFKVMVKPTDADIFAELERRNDLRKRMELDAYTEMKQGWEWEKDKSSFQKYRDKVTPNNMKKSRSSSQIGSDQFTSTTDSGVDGMSNGKKNINNGYEMTNVLNYDERNVSKPTYDPSEYEKLPSGKIIRRIDLDRNSNPSSHNNNGLGLKIPKKLRFKLGNDKEDSQEDVDAIIEQRLHDLE